ncbi:extracellular solute-binding protein [Butyrivibrio sp. XB500-5]|uniref:extracellular solute-binding protein n=1 Tax=Butyrivibrio sp. XB500-5 TaxID=2364880 RepID=UPI000EA9E1A4|nr:extracellular solute-binding protein [Butyrivibrio sp. XB500-5]RKM59038.1 extracellular solute-binding protein [Butyrivibrio sp. XB500-5]
MKKKVLSFLLACAMTLSLAACGKTGGEAPAAPSGSDAGEASAQAEGAASELTDGKFAETRHITVEVYDRNNDGGSDPTNNVYTEYIKKGMLEKHNVEVEFVAIPRWTEVDEINTQLAAGTAPDVCVTYSYPTVKAYADMDAIIDMRPYIDNYKSELPNLWNWLGETNLYWNSDLNDGTTWAIEAKLANMNRVITFIRKDWLDKLNLKEPTTKEEFHEVLVAFKENADTLLGSDANKMVPYSVSYDVGWRAATLIESFLDPDMSDKEYYVNGFDDRKICQNGTKDGVKLLNEWYNEGLLWKDFYLYGSGDSTEDDMMKAGYVGAFTHNWDYPWRNGEDSIAANLKRLVGDDAKYIAIDPFEDKKGGHNKFLAGPIDRKIFFPATNDEPLASMLYLDYISSPEVIEFLQVGEEGVTHKTLDDGGYEILAATGDAIQNSGMNIDYTITCNGLNLTNQELTDKSLAHTYAGIDPQDILDADKIAKTDTRIGINVNVGDIESESGAGDTLTAKRDTCFDNAVKAPTAEFDATWEAGLSDYLSSGGQDIIDERTEKWDSVYSSENIR